MPVRPQTSWIDFEFHPIANLFPLLEGDEYRRFADDITLHGLLDPVWLYEGKILDGRNRYRVCRDRGIELVVKSFTTEFPGEDPVAFVLSRNLHRRHLNESQRAMVAADLATLLDGQRPPNNGHGGSRVPAGTRDNCGSKSEDSGAVTAQTAADALDVSRRSVMRAKKVQKDGAPEVVEAVKDGTVTVGDAEAVVQLPKEEQKAAVEEVRSGKAKTCQEAVKKRTPADKTLDENFDEAHKAIGVLVRHIDALEEKTGMSQPANDSRKWTQNIKNILTGWARRAAQ